MSKKIVCVSCAAIILVTAIVLVINLKNVLKADKVVQCQLKTGEHGKCVERMKCSDSTLHIIERFASDDEDCSGDDGSDIICCVNNFSDSNEKFIDEEPKVNLLNNKMCGVSNSNRIFGGEIASPGEFPFFVALKYKNEKSKEFSFSCGGSLISGKTRR